RAGASPAQNERQAALCEPPAAKLQLDCKLLYTPGGGLSIPGGGLLFALRWAFCRSAGPEGEGGQKQAGAASGRNSRLVSGAVLPFSQAGFGLRRENGLSTRGVSIPPLSSRA